MAALSEKERRAILLRFYEGRNLREVAAALGVTEDAAEKRVHRGVEKLRKFFTNNGVNVGASSVAVVISTHAVQAAPAGLLQSISTAVALGSTTITATAIASAAKAITMTATQKTIIVAGFLAAVGAGVYEARRASLLQSELQTLRQHQAPLSEQIQQLQQGNSDIAFEFASIRGEKDRWERDAAELIKLRAEISRLRSAVDSANAKAESPKDPTEAAVRSWLARVSRLKEHMREKPDAWIPECQFLDDKDWLNASNPGNAPLDSEDGLRRASSSLRQAAKNKFNRMTLSALKGFAQANDGQFPTSLDQLQPFFTVPMDDSILDRYEIVPKKDLPVALSGKWFVAEKAPTDAGHDSRAVIGAQGFLMTDFRIDFRPFPMDDRLWFPYQDFRAANLGVNPTEPAQLLPYAITPEQRAAIQQAGELIRQNQNGP